MPRLTSATISESADYNANRGTDIRGQQQGMCIARCTGTPRPGLLHKTNVLVRTNRKIKEHNPTILARRRRPHTFVPQRVLGMKCVRAPPCPMFSPVVTSQGACYAPTCMQCEKRHVYRYQLQQQMTVSYGKSSSGGDY